MNKKFKNIIRIPRKGKILRREESRYKNQSRRVPLFKNPNPEPEVLKDPRQEMVTNFYIGEKALSLCTFEFPNYHIIYAGNENITPDNELFSVAQLLWRRKVKRLMRGFKRSGRRFTLDLYSNYNRAAVWKQAKFKGSVYPTAPPCQWAFCCLCGDDREQNWDLINGKRYCVRCKTHAHEPVQQLDVSDDDDSDVNTCKRVNDSFR
jgi:hypothetical protein